MVMHKDVKKKKYANGGSHSRKIFGTCAPVSVIPNYVRVRLVFKQAQIL
jgi:hypothetical protein